VVCRRACKYQGVSDVAFGDVPRDRPWGSYSGYFQAPDGQLWEIIWNPALDVSTS